MPCTLPYRKFPDGLKQPIRLLILHPRKSDQTVVLSLKDRSLTSRPPYEALSYHWGSVDHPVVIKSDKDEIFHAERNLANALVRLRYPDKTRALWDGHHRRATRATRRSSGSRTSRSEPGTFTTSSCRCSAPRREWSSCS
jgi:Heterokaryon incompatibility protein (HET)